MAVEGRTHKPVVDFMKCSACSVCMEACPAEIMPEMRQESGSLRGRLYSGADLEVHLNETQAPVLPKCQNACPVSQDVRGYIRLIAQKQYGRALALIRAVNPLPSVCGHVCHRPCESACVRAGLDQSLSIRSLKCFAADRAWDEVLPEKPRIMKNKKVAVIGSGPAGLAAGYDLARMGYAVEIIEAHHRPGGLLAWAIPEFRLPAAVLERDIDFIRKTGVRIRTGACFGRDLTLADLEREGTDAVIIAVGAQKGLTLGFENETRVQGYLECLDFLRRCSDGEFMEPGRDVIVVGGGNAAMDTARSALRKWKANVTLIYRRGPEEMPADREEVLAAMAEGVRIQYFTLPLSFITQDSRITGLACIRTELAEADAGGRARPIPIKGSEFQLQADTVISALGQQPDPQALEKAWEPLAGSLKPDRDSLTTRFPKVFVAGDFAHGPATVVEAMASGKKAALKTDQYLSSRI